MAVGRDPMAMGLTDLGMSVPSESLSVGSDTPMVLDELLKTSRQLESPEARALMLQKQGEALKQQEDRSLLDELLSPMGITTGLGSIAALAAGNPGLAAGLGLGNLQASSLLAREANSAKREAIVKNQEMTEKALERVQKQQGQMIDIFTENPEAFVDPITGRQLIDPTSLGTLLTGREIPISATAKRRLSQQNENMKRNYDFLESRFAAAKTPQARRQVLGAMESLSGWTFPEGVKSALAEVEMEADEYAQHVNETLLKFYLDPNTDGGLDALRLARQEPGGMENLKNYLPMVRHIPESDLGDFDINDAAFDAARRMDEWWNDPNTPMEEKLATGGDIEAIARIVFADEPGTLAILNSRVSATAPWLTGEAVLSSYFRANGALNDFNQVLAVPELINAKTPEERARILRQHATTNLKAIDDSRREASITVATEAAITGAQRITATVPGVPPGVALNLANKAVERLNARLTPEQRNDPDAIQVEYSKIIDEYIAELKRRNEQ